MNALLADHACLSPRIKPNQACQPNRTTGRGTSEAAAPAERHYSLTGQHGVWARARRLATLDFWFDSLDEVFEAGDNVDLSVRFESYWASELDGGIQGYWMC